MSSVCNWKFEAENFTCVVYAIGSLKQGLSTSLQWNTKEYVAT